MAGDDEAAARGAVTGQQPGGAKAAADPAARFDAALKKAGLVLDGRDKAAALRVFAGLQAACALLKQDATDDPR